jgi:CRP-like cAMP-binding protein
VSREGRELFLDFYRPGRWFGESATLGRFPRRYDVDAVDDVTLLHVPTTAIEELLADHNELARALLTLEAQRIDMLFSVLDQFFTQSIDQRLAQRLLLMSAYYGTNTDRGVVIDLNLTQDVLAKLIGATRQRVNQIVRRWESEGIIEQRYGRIVLLDMARLEDLARY